MINEQLFLFNSFGLNPLLDTWNLGLGQKASATDLLGITIGTASYRGIAIKGAASQSGNYIHIQDSAGNNKFLLQSDGSIFNFAINNAGGYWLRNPANTLNGAVIVQDTSN